MPNNICDNAEELIAITNFLKLYRGTGSQEGPISYDEVKIFSAYPLGTAHIVGQEKRHVAAMVERECIGQVAGKRAVWKNVLVYMPKDEIAYDLFHHLLTITPKNPPYHLTVFTPQNNKALRDVCEIGIYSQDLWRIIYHPAPPEALASIAF